MNVEKIRQLQPRLFSEFAETLKQDRLNHAYLFAGNFGSFEMAQLLAQSLFCEEKKTVWGCGSCRSCRLIAEENFSDVTIIKPVNQIIKTEKIREIVGRFSQSGMEGNKQVFIICDADKMHINAANSLLKVIEEPQSETYCFFLTRNEQLILPTIKSRTQIFHFLKDQSLLQNILEKKGLVRSRAELLAGFSQTEEEAKQLADSSAFLDLANECERFVRDSLKEKEQVYLQAAKLSKMADDKEKQEQVFKLLEILLAREIKTGIGRKFLKKLILSQKMWSANVSFQNSIEYMLVGNEE
ncbi:MAG: DNA polymerase III subunit delta' [Streptococcus sp.]|nr:DNA polymerase III subunit delta' [Streptococcus sp.]